MKGIEEIKEKISSENQALEDYDGYVYECAGDCIRGWIEALEWVLESNP